MANSKILTQEQEMKLRQPIDEYVGKIQKQIDDLRRVETHGRLVQNDELRTAQQRLRHAHALLVALGQVLHQPVGNVQCSGDGHDPVQLR